MTSSLKKHDVVRVLPDSPAPLSNDTERGLVNWTDIHDKFVGKIGLVSYGTARQIELIRAPNMIFNRHWLEVVQKPEAYSEGDRVLLAPVDIDYSPEDSPTCTHFMKSFYGECATVDGIVVRNDVPYYLLDIDDELHLWNVAYLLPEEWAKDFIR